MLQSQFELLEDIGDFRAQVEIWNVESLAYRIVECARGTRPAIVDYRDLHGLWEAAAREAGLAHPATFLNR